jgi:hypothetical protein
MNSSILSLLPGFTSEAQQLFTLLTGVTFVLAVAGLVILTIQSFRERSLNTILPTLVRLIVCVILLGSIALWGNTIAGGVNDLIGQLGLSGTSSGIYTAYQKAIAQKWGTASATQGSFESGGSNGQSAGTTGTWTGAVPQASSGTTITAYGYANDLTPDPASSAGIGNHGNQLAAYTGTGVASAALTASAAAQYGVQLNQNFTVQGANGQTYVLNYADTAPESDSRIDIYDPNSLLTGGGNDNLFSSTANSVALGDMAPMGGNGIGGVIGSAISRIGDSLNIAILWPLTHMLSLMALGILWLMQAVQQILFIIEVAVSPIFIGMLMIPRLVGTATKFFASLIAITLWGLGWAICDMLTTVLINLAVNPTNNVAVTALSPITAIGVWITLAIWVIGSSFLAPLVVSAMLMQGSSGLAAVFGATVGGATSMFLGAGANTVVKSATSTVSAVSTQANTRMNSVAESFAKRPEPTEKV